MCRGPEAEFRLRAFSCHRCFCWVCCRGFGRRRPRPISGSTAGVSAGCATGVPGAVGPARPLTVRAASFARRVGSKPGQTLRPRRRPPHWRHVVRVARPCPPRPSFVPRTDEHAINFACNSLATISNLEFAVLELQRFQTLLNLRPVELHAIFGGGRAAQPVGGLHAGGAWWLAPGRPLPRSRRSSRLSGPSLAECLRVIRIGCAHLDRLCGSG